MGQAIVIVGAGIAGLGSALALSRTGQRIIVLEQDDVPLTGTPDTAFETWQRPGVPQLRHSHGFLARLRNLLRDHYPALYQELLAAGARELRFVDSLPPGLQARYTPEAADDDLTALLCRRTTFESVLRRYVLAQPGVCLQSGARVTGVLTAAQETPLRLTGVAMCQQGTAGTVPAGVVIDASGRRSPFVGWLRALGASIVEESEPTGILYYSRFYRLRPGAPEPERGGYSTLGDLGYLKFGVWPADNGTFSVTLALPTVEPDLRVVRHPEVFEQVCRTLPALARWTAEAVPTSAVFAMGDLHSSYRCFVVQGQPAALGYFAVGEAAIHTNPLYGRGSTLSLLQAHLLAELLAADIDPQTRAQRFQRLTQRHLYPFYDTAVRQDRAGLQRARRLQEAHPAALPRRRRWGQAMIRQGLVPALRGDLTVRRAALRDFHMLAPPGVALRRPGIMLRILRFWWRGQRRNADLYPLPPGPERQVMRQQLGLA